MSTVLRSLNLKKTIEKSLKGRSFLTLADYETEEIVYLLEQALELKKMQKTGQAHAHLQGKTLGMIFEKSSTRTRVSFEVGMMQLGGHALFLSAKDIQLGRGESIADTARVLSRYVDGIMVRAYSHEAVEQFAHYATVPVINGLTDMHHPTQVLADLLTIFEHKGKLAGLNMCYIGDGNNNMTHSLIEGAAKVGMNITVASPKGYEPDPTIVMRAKAAAIKMGSKIQITTSPEAAMQAADVVVTDVWTSMGQEEQRQERLRVFQNYQVNASLCAHAAPDYLFLHCLPAHRGEEVTADIIDGVHSVVFDEAENRLHVQKAIVAALMSP